MNDKQTITLVVGFYNYSDLQVLQEGLRGSDVQIVSAQQDAQRVYDDAVNMSADAVLLCPDIAGYRHGLIDDLVMNPEKAIPVIAWVLPRDDRGQLMTRNGAKGVIALPMDGQGITKLLHLLPRAIEELRAERQQGAVRLARGQATPAGRQGAWKQRVITVYVPKGGGSARTTLAVNLAVALAHERLGAQPTCLLDLDMTKGDCHTFLGYTVNASRASQDGLIFLDKGFYNLLVNVAGHWDDLDSAAQQKCLQRVTPDLLNKFLVSWQPDHSLLHLLPGLTHPHQGSSEELTNWPLALAVARRAIQVAKSMYSFVVLDIGQDYNLPLHRAALEEADEVLVAVPPIATALTDTENALAPLEHAFGGLGKFKLVISAFDPSFGISEKEIARRVGLPKLITIPFDAQVAAASINTCTPFVLTDGGPLGEAIRMLSGAYLPYLKDERRGAAGRRGNGNLFGALRRALVKEA
ncbi:MAG: hypothetical protein PVF45_13600 [Anaerolineae bacterium]|jgi:Flp pilus assembly CpaE family ATPase